ncbi:hypothetical protein [Polaromonas sp.]|uniref:hypothetical protein n=1 Tax=Polaromonas sp. TaxID=1869339 RepID=UPI0024894951|nr:hypothetical protein [Polaromonas sp.]MDI1340001.1 hypothetical protein [Polaromonas sp.]
MDSTKTLFHGTNEHQLVEAKMNHFESRCEDLMSLLAEKRRFSPGERDHAESLYRALKDDLKEAAKCGTVSGKRQEPTEAERCFYQPAVQRAALALRPATNSHPVQSNWFSAVHEAQMEFSYWRHNMRHNPH